MNGKSTDVDTMAAGDVLDGRSLADDLDEFFSGVTVGEDVTDVTGSHFLLQRNADGVLKTC